MALRTGACPVRLPPVRHRRMARRKQREPPQRRPALPPVVHGQQADRPVPAAPGGHGPHGAHARSGEDQAPRPRPGRRRPAAADPGRGRHRLALRAAGEPRRPPHRGQRDLRGRRGLPAARRPAQPGPRPGRRHPAQLGRQPDQHEDRDEPRLGMAVPGPPGRPADARRLPRQAAQRDRHLRGSRANLGDPPARPGGASPRRGRRPQLQPGHHCQAGCPGWRHLQPLRPRRPHAPFTIPQARRGKP